MSYCVCCSFSFTWTMLWGGGAKALGLIILFWSYIESLYVVTEESKNKHSALTFRCRCHCRGDDVTDSSLLTGSEEESTLESFIPLEDSSLLMWVSYLALLFLPSGLGCSHQEYGTPFLSPHYTCHSLTHTLTHSLMLNRCRNLVTKNILCSSKKKNAFSLSCNTWAFILA